MTAPTLALVKTPGICLHFHGRSQSARNALLASISKVAGHAIYSLPDALKHVVALKGHHKDSTLHIAEVEDDDIKGMHRFIRRYFLGRKGKDGPVAGIIISTGNSPLGQKGGHLFTHNKRVLAVDVELPEDHTATYTELQPLQDALIEALTVHRDETLSALKGKKEELLRAEPQAKDQVGKQVASIFWLCAAVGTWFQEQGKLSWWKGRTIQNLFNEIIVKYNQHECFISALHKLSLIMPTNAKIGEYKIKRPREMEEISRGEILIPTAEMREVVPPQHTLRQWTAWLLKNTILIPNKAGRLSATYYSKKQGKSIKGYLVNHRKLHKVLNRAQKNVAKSSYLVF
ncbi:hypothetical protein SYK_12100 [Pseudodesulfovibrio nedwellii]|uniref:Uncharacterized protein n=2 Tax=Pseudodesulfovibrio nedwellii TaxID=2973072 RepID=A0ABM8AZ95_9BACT|nr:hypothetical protein SYK_12100 [Pseudodesulfovibrio nedwellii]